MFSENPRRGPSNATFLVPAVLMLRRFGALKLAQGEVTPLIYKANRCLFRPLLSLPPALRLHHKNQSGTVLTRPIQTWHSSGQRYSYSIRTTTCDCTQLFHRTSTYMYTRVHTMFYSCTFRNGVARSNTLPSALDTAAVYQQHPSTERTILRAMVHIKRRIVFGRHDLSIFL